MLLWRCWCVILKSQVLSDTQVPPAQLHWPLPWPFMWPLYLSARVNQPKLALPVHRIFGKVAVTQLGQLHLSCNKYLCNRGIYQKPWDSGGWKHCPLTLTEPAVWINGPCPLKTSSNHSLMLFSPFYVNLQVQLHSTSCFHWLNLTT